MGEHPQPNARGRGAGGDDIGSPRFAGDVSLTFAGQAATYALAFASTIVIARLLGPTGRGTVAVALTLTLTLVQVGSLGLITSCTYFVARGQSTPQSAAALALWLSLTLGVALGSALMAFGEIAPDVVRVERTTLAIVAIGFPGILYMLLLQAIALGGGRTGVYNAAGVYRAGAAIAGLLVWGAVAGLNVRSSVAISIGAWWLAAALTLTHLSIPGWWRPRFDVVLVSKMLRYGLRVYGGTVLGFLLVRLDLLLVNGYLGSREAGVYSVTAAIAEAMLLIPLVVGLNLLPRVARGVGPAMSAAAFRATAIVLGGACIAVAVAAAPLVKILFGAEFSDAAELLQLLAPGILALGLATVLSHHFAGEGYPLRVVAPSGIALVINAALTLALLGPLGVRGAAVASSISYVLFLVMQVRLFLPRIEGYQMLIPRWRDVTDLVRLARGRDRDNAGPA